VNFLTGNVGISCFTESDCVGAFWGICEADGANGAAFAKGKSELSTMPQKKIIGRVLFEKIINIECAGKLKFK